MTALHANSIISNKNKNRNGCSCTKKPQKCNIISARNRKATVATNKRNNKSREGAVRVTM
jgi:hypothetical protein